MTSLWTIGHSTRTLDGFVEALRSFRIEVLVDVRRFPASRRHPHFATDPLRRGLFAAGIEYVYMGDELGGFRKTRKDSPNVGLENSSFRGYADWTSGAMFRAGVARLLALAASKRAAYMCAERHPSSCHRRIVSDYLMLVHGCDVHHILDAGKAEPHVPLRVAQVVDGELRYTRGPQRELDVGLDPPAGSEPTS